MMSKTRALVEAKAKWGKAAAIRYNRGALTEPAKAPLRERLQSLRAEANPETKKERNDLTGTLMTHRCEVGYVAGVGGVSFYCIQGSGDTWEAALQQAASR
jgi:hypothetical protein